LIDRDDAEEDDVLVLQDRKEEKSDRVADDRRKSHAGQSVARRTRFSIAREAYRGGSSCQQNVVPLRPRAVRARLHEKPLTASIGSSGVARAPIAAVASAPLWAIRAIATTSFSARLAAASGGRWCASR